MSAHNRVLFFGTKTNVYFNIRIEFSVIGTQLIDRKCDKKNVYLFTLFVVVVFVYCCVVGFECGQNDASSFIMKNETTTIHSNGIDKC